MASGDVDRDNVGSLRADLRDTEAVAHGERDRLSQPEHEHQDHDRDVQRNPVGQGDRIDEVGSHCQLVQEGQRDREVRVQVDSVPGLV